MYQCATYTPCPLPTLFLQMALMCYTRPILTTEASAFIAANTLSNYYNSAGTSAPNSTDHNVISISSETSNMKAPANMLKLYKKGSELNRFKKSTFVTLFKKK